MNKEVRASRQKDFEGIGRGLFYFLKMSTENLLLAEGDALKLLKLIPDHSVSLILTDPPYHSTKKKTIQGDTSFKTDSEYVKWISNCALEWYRILKPNGSILCFCSSKLASKLEVEAFKNFNILNQIVWTKPNDPGFDGWKQKMKKEALHQWYPHTERIIFAEPAYDGNLFQSYFGNLLRNLRKKAGFSMHLLSEKTGACGRVNHGGAVSNWEAGRNVPSREQYEKIRNALLESENIDEVPYYEEAIRQFKTNGSCQFTDVWDFPSVRPHKGKHPAEKPISLLEHAIKATTYEGDMVLDCFSGSGNTAIASLNLNRSAVLIDSDSKWIESSEKILKEKFGF